jgi:hypothetical protein
MALMSFSHIIALYIEKFTTGTLVHQFIDVILEQVYALHWNYTHIAFMTSKFDRN